MVAAWEKYSAWEHERRFLLQKLPRGVVDPRRIYDRYLTGTRLRLRLTESPDGQLLERKLGHKRRVEDNDPTAVMHTNLYLDSGEFELLAALSGRNLVKVRWIVDLDGEVGSVDVFEGDLLGLVMLEVDLKSATRMASFSPPSWAGPEVTCDESFTGGTLSTLLLADLDEVISRLMGSGP